jgi:hypothetical protein
MPVNRIHVQAELLADKALANAASHSSFDLWAVCPRAHLAAVMAASSAFAPVRTH